MRILFRSQVILIAIVAAFAALGGSPALATHTPESTVSATVTPVVVSVIVSPTSVDYGVVELNTANNLPTNQAGGESFTATNNGSITEDFEIKGGNTTPDAWTLAGTAGSAQYVHKASNDNFSVQTITLTTSPQSLDTGIAVNGDVSVNLKLDSPTDTTTTATQTAPVTVIATAP